MSTVIKVENLSKPYRLGVINRDMLYKDLQSRWAKFRGKEDANSKISPGARVLMTCSALSVDEW